MKKQPISPIFICKTRNCLQVKHFSLSQIHICQSEIHFGLNQIHTIIPHIYNFRNLLAQREGEIESEYQYKAFISTSDKNALSMLSKDYPKRWTIEDFFNFEGDMGWNRASTMNLNIRYGKMSLALIAQATVYQLRQKLPAPYKKWTASHLADTIFRGFNGDLRVEDDTIVVTFYNVPENLNLQHHYEKFAKET